MSTTETNRRPIHVSDINERDRIPQEAIDDLVRQIADRFHPQRIILFGSYAYGTPRPDSDVDLLVVMDTPLREIEQALQIILALDYHFGLDLIVKTPHDLAKRIALGDSFLQEVTQKGRVLHERSYN